MTDNTRASNRATMYMFRTAAGEYVYVSYDKVSCSYESFKLFVGDGSTMREIKVSSVTRRRDGGTTYIRTAEGTLFSPSAFKRNEAATWGEEALIKLDPNRFEITEVDGTVTLKVLTATANDGFKKPDNKPTGRRGGR